MKKVTGILLTFAVIASSLLFTSCSRKKDDSGVDLADGKKRLGLGIYAYYGASVNASEDSDGYCTALQTVAAVFLGGDGRIIDCKLDCAESPMRFTYDGSFTDYGEYETKSELGNAYGMKSAGAKLEWYAQAEAFEKLCRGKTLDEVSALASDGKSTDEVIDAGCTIDVSDFIRAAKAAVNGAKVTDATEKDTLSLGVYTEGDGLDATAESVGSSEIETTFAAILSNSDGKVADCRIDCIDAEITFDGNGTALTPSDSSITSKRTAGDDYGMKAAGAKLEWYKQADLFEDACIGKTLAGVLLLKDGDHGNEEVISAGCTVRVDGMVMAMSKALAEEEGAATE